MVVLTFSVLDKDGKERFFEESFLLADVKSDVVLGILFLTMSNANVDFRAWNQQQRSYITRDVLPTTKRVELIGKKKFAATSLNLEHEFFVVHVVALGVDLGDEVYPSKKTQIAHLKVDEAPTKVFSEYTDFVDVFSSQLAAELPKHMRINNHAIELVND